MIPQQIRLSGFLSYRAEQVVRFAGAPVWMLAGLNGSGKSSVFDAVTYALFGHHRGGSQNAIELIHKESSALAVDFDFLLDNVLYRARRTLKRSAKGSASGTQQVYWHNPNSAGNAKADGWEAVPDTNKKVDFDLWIHDHIGLNYETFTSSVLLLQGKAEKLLDSKPSGRAEVLAGIVNLERYQKLHEKANTRKLKFKAQLDTLQSQVEGVPMVSEAEYATAEDAIATADATRLGTQQSIDRLIETEAAAHRYTSAQQQLASASVKLAAAEKLLSASGRIQADYTRLTELQAVLPAVSTVVKERTKLHDSKLKSDRYRKDKTSTQERQTLADATETAAKRSRESLKKSLETDEATLQKLGSRLVELSAIMQTVKLVEDLETDQKRLETERNRFPADPNISVADGHAKVERFTNLVQLLNPLQRVHDEQFKIQSAKLRATQARQGADTTKAQGKRARATTDGIIVARKVAADAKQTADEQAGGAAALVAQARASLAELDTLRGATTCKACGQPLTEAHLRDERRTREKELARAETHQTATLRAKANATAEEAELAMQEASSTEELTKLREAYSLADAEAKNAAESVTHHEQYLRLALAELAPDYQERVQTEPGFPSRDELSRLSGEVAGLDSARKALQTALKTLAECASVQTKLESVRAALAKHRATLPASDLVQIRQEQLTKHADETSIQNRIRATKQSIAKFEVEADVAGREKHSTITLLADLNGKLQTEDAVQNHCQETIERETAKLPTDWQVRISKAGLSEYHTWATQLQELIAKDTATTYQQLEQARVTLAAAQQAVADCQLNVSGFAESARRAPSEVREELNAARQLLDRHDRELYETRRQKSVLDGYRESRARLGTETVAADAEYHRYKTLAELLSRDRLQRHLVRKAERQIVDYANGVLDRLSGGQLFLKLVVSEEGGAADRALELEAYNRTTGGAPINVMFLSGSQKFRVAVSLALGIGQYASKQHRAIESVIIDEGFGCLDRIGRQVMIQELQNLRGHLHCILLVSHQEEFADAFADGYRFALTDGATTVTRFQR